MDKQEMICSRSQSKLAVDLILESDYGSAGYFRKEPGTYFRPCGPYTLLSLSFATMHMKAALDTEMAKHSQEILRGQIGSLQIFMYHETVLFYEHTHIIIII